LPGDLGVRFAVASALKYRLRNAEFPERASVSCSSPVSASSLSQGRSDPFRLGTGIALTHRLEKQRQVVVAISHDASAIEPWHEAFRFAGIHKLPVIYVLSNAAGESSFIEQHSQVFDGVGFMSKEYGFPGVIVDGADVVAVWRVAQESIHRARNGAGPTLIECPIQLPGSWEPLAHLERYMKRRDAWDERWRRGIVEKLAAEIKPAAESAG
jgi:pyruvate dehydrogenase E1 component alpha subunit